MSGRERALYDTVRVGGLLASGRPVVVLLSGGRDSTCLLDLAVRIAGAEQVSALHVNYRLRGAAEIDQLHCSELCERLGVPLALERPALRQTGNVQEWARDVRYAAATRIALDLGADVAAGHTASDQVETVLYRLASSPSRRSLLGMREREVIPAPAARAHGARAGARARMPTLVRPLLEFTREQTAAYCTARGLPWREDESNESDAYARGRVRHGLLPALRAVHPGAERNVLALLELLRDEAEVLEALVDELLAGRGEIALERLRELPPALRRLLVQRLADEAAGGPLPGVARRADELARLGDRGTKAIDLGAGVRAVSEYGVLRFERPGVRLPAPEAVRLAVPGSVRFGSCEVRCDPGQPAHEPGVLDRAALGPELLVRSWRPGDRMAPLGLHGSKSLQDLFTARRVPRERRAAIAVVESAGEIAWVAGVATSDRFKVTDSTTDAVQLSCHELSPRLPDDK